MKVSFLFGILAFMVLSSGATFLAQYVYPTSATDGVWRQLAYRLVVIVMMGVEISVCLALLWVVYGI